jgi:heavy metal translocating P-type ATPase
MTPAGSSSDVSTSVVCLHCGSMVPEVSARRGIRFCCAGCESVNAFLQGHSLGDAYNRFSRLGLSMARPSPITDAPSPERFDEPALFARTQFPDGTHRLFVPALRCAACLWLVEGALKNVEGVEDVRADLSDSVVVLKLREGASLVPAAWWLSEMGYHPFPPAQSGESDAARAWRRERLKSVGISGALFLNAMMFAAALYLGPERGMGEATASVFRWLSLVVTVPALVFPGRSFFLNAWNGLRAGGFHYDLPIAVSLGVAFGVSVRATLMESGDVYFDSITGLIFFLGAGRALNDSLLASARKLVRGGSSLLPARASVLKPGDSVVVAAGEAFPADGTLREGVTDVDESALTGENRPVPKRVGAKIFAGTLNLAGAVTLQAEATLDDTLVAKLQRTAEEAFRQKTRFERLADRALKPFVFAVLAIAVLGALVWSWIDASQAVPVTLALFIVGCPCALALSTPLASAVALRRAWRAGVVAKTSDVFERLADIDVVLFDKTGTLTRGSPRVTINTSLGVSLDMSLGGDETFRTLVCSLAKASRHPFSSAISRYLGVKDAQGEAFDSLLRNREEIPGCGVRATFGQGRTLWLGSPEGIAQHMPLSVAVRTACVQTRLAEPGLSLVLATDGEQAEIFGLEDEVESDAAAVVSLLKAEGLRVQVVSGDTRGAVERVANVCGVLLVDAFHGLTPDAKGRHVVRLQESGLRVLMVGDGINDAIALAKADVGVTLERGLDVARASALIHLRGDGLALLPPLFSFAKKANKTMLLVLCTSAAYNAVALGLAMLGYIHPLAAALIMPASSLTTLAIATFRNGGAGSWLRR